MSAATLAEPAASRVGATTARADALVAARRDEAVRLGHDLAEQLQDPEALVRELRTALAALADPDYANGQRRVAPGIGPVVGVRQPLLQALERGFRAGTRQDRPGHLLEVAARLLREPAREARWFAFDLLDRTVRDEPERTWQLLRGAAAEADDWITVDTLARPFGRGILAEPYRWAELEQLIYSPSSWERRLVGSTIATLPHVDASSAAADLVPRGLGLVRELIGDREPEVRKALSWALRTLAGLDGPATAAFLAEEAETATRTDDGHRAWVIRDALPKLAPSVADPLRARLDGIRTAPGAPSTSRAAQAAASFTGLGLDVPPDRRPVTPRR